MRTVRLKDEVLTDVDGQEIYHQELRGQYVDVVTEYDGEFLVQPEGKETPIEWVDSKHVEYSLAEEDSVVNPHMVLKPLDIPDPIQPPHYAQYTYKPIDVIYDWELPYPLDHVVQYLARYRFKNGIEDLKKAQSYLNYYIERQES